jgi:hypothetical protein
MHFCKFIASIYEFEKFKAIDKGLYKLATIKFMELLSSLTKHSRFGSFYELIPKVERLDSIRYLIVRLALSSPMSPGGSCPGYFFKSDHPSSKRSSSRRRE